MVTDAFIAERLAALFWCLIFVPVFGMRLYYCALVLVIAVAVPDGLEYAPLLFGPVELAFQLGRFFSRSIAR